MFRPFRSLPIVLALFALVGGIPLTTGCGPTEKPTADKKDDHGDHDHDDHDHEGDDHGHDHGPAGPHGGHTESFDQPGYAFEWIHDDDKQLVRIVILDEAKKEAVKVAAESVTITCDKGREPQTFTLPAVEADADGKASEFSLEDGQLIVALQMGVNVKVSIDGTEFTKTLEPHDHHH